MKTYYISTNPESYGAFATSETAFMEAEEIADAVRDGYEGWPQVEVEVRS